MLKRFAPILLLFTCTCIDPFSTDPGPHQPRYVVEGTFTDRAGIKTVTITTSAKYSQGIDGLTRYVSEAFVKICDDDNNCTNLMEGEKGRYSAEVSGTTGKFYHVEIELKDGQKIYSKPELMTASPPISKLYDEFDPGTVQSHGFNVYVDTDDPGDQRNYYKWETIAYFPYSLRCFYKLPQKDLTLIMSDKNVNGKTVSRIKVREVPYSGTGPYVVEVLQLALSSDAYQYVDGVVKQIETTGSIFDPPPSYLRGNLYDPDDETEDVLGYFLVAGTSSSAIAIDRSVSRTGVSPNPDAESLVPEPVYCGDPCNLMCVAFGGGQCGFAPCPPECHYLPNVTSNAPPAWPFPHKPCGN